MSNDFVHLHVHSEFSLLDGLGRVEKLVQRAQRLGQPALALTDHGTMHGVIPFFRAAKAAGIHPVIGVEAYITRWGRPMAGRDAQLDKDRHHLLLLAQNQTGYRNLLKICSDAQMQGYYYRPRIDADYLAQHSEGLICTTGCLGAEVPALLNSEKGSRPQEKLALERLHWYLDLFGKERFYIELQEHDIPSLREVNKTLLDWSRRHDVGLVATNDVHYVEPGDARYHDVLLCVQTSSLLSQADRMRMPGGSFYLKSGLEMRDTFRPLVDLPESAFTNTLRIAEMCQVDLEDKQFHLPNTEVPEGHSYESYLRQMTEEGLRWRYDGRAGDAAVQTRKEHELKIIHQMGFDVYFLIVADLCRYARDRGIWYNVRGSGAGSIVAFAVGITGIDPLSNNLVFERFLNPGRVSMPDFDLDFPDDQREEMIRYTIAKYGAEHVAQIVSFGRMKARAAVRDVARALDIPLGEVDRIAKQIPAIPGKPVTIEQCLGKDEKKPELAVPELIELYQGDAKVRELLDTASALEGVARHASTHAAAVIVTDQPLTEYLPVMRPQKAVITEAVTQFEFPICESIGLLKVDFLGLSTLTVMREATKLIHQRHGVTWTLDNIPLDDVESYRLLSSGEVSGVFQVEGAGLRRMLTEMQPREFNHIVAAISLYRPGPMDFIPEYVAVMHGRKEAEYVHPALEPILAETYGVCVSGDAVVVDARTGKRYRLDELEHVSDLKIQGVDESWQPAIGRVTHWIDSGYKAVFELTLRNGAQIKVTGDHRLLTEDGWRPLCQLKPGDYIATPFNLFGPVDSPQPIDRRRLRILAYLIADGSLTSGTLADFVSKDAAMLQEYLRCLEAFDDVKATFTQQIRGVTRIGAAKNHGAGLHYHAPNGLLAWLRELRLKDAPGSNPGGVSSRNKFIPDFVFQLGQEDILFFLASLWDGDGYIGRKLCHYKTVSRQLASDLQTLLLRAGISSVIHTARYSVAARNGSTPQRISSYQVTVYDTKLFAALIQPHMVSAKRTISCSGVGAPTVSRALFLQELDSVWTGSYHSLMREHGIDRQHFYSAKRERNRIPARVVERLTSRLPLPSTERSLNVRWNEIVAIEEAGQEHVYDLTVEDLHSFVANGIIVHNCVYQEQVIQLLTEIAGYTAGEADNVRRGISKKSEKTLLQHREIFAKGAAQKSGLTRQESDAIWDALLGFARYGFNKSHAADYAVVTVQTAYLKAHYPLEYMAAMLYVERDNPEKVAYYITEARRMGIEVLPPDINASAFNFTVEQSASDGPMTRDLHIGYPFPVPPGAAIRYGLAAVKNVGEGPVEAILAGRQAGSFAALDALCERVDLRKVGKKALECLIKVGALDDFGERAQLLEGMEQMIGVSRSRHEAEEAGQLSMFDLFGGGLETAAHSFAPALTLPAVEPLNPKQRLEMEKELLGVYVSSHPLQQMAVDLSGVVTCTCGELGEAQVGKTVVLAGNVVRVNQITTKKGDRMAFVTLEDLQGQCDVVVFPRTWEETKELWVQDRIVLVRGKAEKRGEGINVLCDTVQTYVTRALAADESDAYAALRAAPLFVDGNGHGRPAAGPAPVAAAAPRSGLRLADAAEELSYGDEGGDGAANDSPFALEEPEWLRDAPAMWEGVGGERSTVNGERSTVGGERSAVNGERSTVNGERSTVNGERSAVGGERSAVGGERSTVNGERSTVNGERSTVGGERSTVGGERSTVGGERSTVNGERSTVGGEPDAARPEDASAPSPQPPALAQHPQPPVLAQHPQSSRSTPSPREIRVTMQRTPDAERDKRLLAWVVEALKAKPGPDRFCIVVRKNGAAVQLDFPNDTTTFTPALEQQLVRRLGVGSVEVRGDGDR
jgi:DNA polymerase-3 subunit alpha